MRACHRERRSGFALVATLWLLIALGAVGLDAALHSRARRQAAANVLDGARARAAALSGSEYARSMLTAALLGQAEELRSEAMASARSSRSRRTVERRSVSRLFRGVDPLEDPWRSPQDLIVGDALRLAEHQIVVPTLSEEVVRHHAVEHLWIEPLTPDEDAEQLGSITT